MLALIISFLSLLFFIALIVLLLNYTVFLYENKKIDDIAKQIKRENRKDEILSGKNNGSLFTSIDLGGKIGKFKRNSHRGLIISRQNSQVSNNWIVNFFQNIIDYIKIFFGHILDITGPSQQAYKTETQIKQEQALSETVQKLTQSPTKTSNVTLDTDNKTVQKTKAKTKKVYSKTKPIDLNRFKKNDDSQPTIIKVDTEQESKEDTVKENISQSTQDNATLNLAKNEEEATQNSSKKSSHSNNSLSLFKKMETKILNQLQTAGLNHYDIWLKLGELYEKYQDIEEGGLKKAIDVYSLVLKHGNGKEKEYARDKLIGLS